MRSFQFLELWVTDCDAEVYNIKKVQIHDLSRLLLSGGGGTDFRPVFSYIDEELDTPSLLLYFSDTKGTFPEAEPFYEVIWISSEKSEVPFGELLLIEKDEEK